MADGPPATVRLHEKRGEASARCRSSGTGPQRAARGGQSPQETCWRQELEPESAEAVAGDKGAT
eukprot:3139101-Pyramimonas_sp.AAC.1